MFSTLRILHYRYLSHLVAASIIVFFTLLTIAACKKRYDPNVKDSDNNVLVVEGNMDPGDDSTFIRLTRTVNINDTAKIRTEEKAQVIIEGKDNSKRTLTGKGKGFYVSSGLHLTIGNDYRLRIKTLGGEEYLSDYVQAKRSPKIDSLTWSLDTVGLHFYVHTHDPTQSTVYYRWDCVEAWEIRMPIIAEVIYKNGIIRPALPQDNMWECYSYDSTESLIVANSRQLSNDVISYKEVRTIPYHHGKVKWDYGILVKQFAIDEQAYKYFSFMKDHSEGMGSIFALQPFSLKGNIRMVKDSTRYAVGYITSSTITTKSRRIKGPELIYWRPVSQYSSVYCTDSTILVRPNITDFRYYFDQLGYMPFKEFVVSGVLLGYYSSRPECIDCKVWEATPAVPYFF